MKLLPLTQGFEAQVDDEDFDRLSGFNWYAVVTKSRRKRKAYAARNLTVSLNPRKQKRLDNRKANLRLIPVAANRRSRCSAEGSSSRFVGVSRDRRGKFSAEISAKGKRRWLGYFDNEIEAAKARDDAAIEVYGCLAKLNFPQRFSASA